MLAPRSALKGASGACLLFAALGMLAAAKYFSVEIPKTEKVEGTVLTSELKTGTYRRQWIEFVLEGNGETFVYDHPFSDIRRVSSELRKGTTVSMEIARSSTVEIWVISLNGRVHASSSDVLALHREKGWAGVAMAAIALFIFLVRWLRRERAARFHK